MKKQCDAQRRQKQWCHFSCFAAKSSSILVKF